MNITIIYPNIGNIPSYNFGIGIIAAYLKKNGHKVQGLHINPKSEKELDLKGIEKEIKDFNPKLIAFSSVENQFKFVQIIARHLKKNGVTAKFDITGYYFTTNVNTFVDGRSVEEQDVWIKVSDSVSLAPSLSPNNSYAPLEKNVTGVIVSDVLVEYFGYR